MSKPDAKKNVLEEEEKSQEEIESGERVSGEPESNLAAVGGGGIAGAAAGATIGTAVGGPIGGALGAAIGGIAGGVAGDQIQDNLDPKLEEVYWEENFRTRPYYKAGDTYQTYLPSYRFGWESASRREYGNRSFEELETDLEKDWKTHHSASGDWASVKDRVRDAFERIRTKIKKS
jgi:hypothetical protein